MKPPQMHLFLPKRQSGWLLFLLWIALNCMAAPAWAKRVALLIANQQYQHTSTLSNPFADADLIEKSLRKAGFEVVQKRDLDDRAMEREIAQFAVTADGAEIALIYYAGHGIEVDGSNWLLPIDAQLESEVMLDVEALKVERLLEVTSGADNRILILDACRNNPFPNMRRRDGSQRSAGGSGLAELTRGIVSASNSDEPIGTVIAYSTAPNTKAQDGPKGGNSPFAEALAKWIAEPGLEVSAVFSRVRADMLKKLRQEPWVNHSIDPIVLVPRQQSMEQPVQTRSADELIEQAFEARLASNFQESARLLDQAIKMGSVEAMKRRLDLPDEVDLPEAEELALVERVAASGDLDYKYGLSNLRIKRQEFAKAEALLRELQGTTHAVFAENRLRCRADWGGERPCPPVDNPQPIIVKLRALAPKSKLAQIALLYGLFNSGNKNAQEKSSEIERLARPLSAADEEDGHYYLGICLFSGRCESPANPARGLQLLERAAVLGQKDANLMLGQIFQAGAPPASRDLRRARQYLEYAAKEGHTQAKSELAQLLLFEPEIKDEEKGLEWLQQAAAEGWANAQNVLGLAYLEARYGLSRDEKKGLQLLEQAAEHDPAAKYNLSGQYRRGELVKKNLKRANELLNQSAEAGWVSAQNELGYCLAFGCEGITKDLPKALPWYEKAVVQGEPWAMVNLASILLYVREHANPQRARALLEQAINANDAKASAAAAYELGNIYYSGLGVIPDQAKGIELLRSAARQGNAKAVDDLKRLGIQ